MNMTSGFKLTAIAGTLAVLALAACGGGGGSHDEPAATTHDTADDDSVEATAAVGTPNLIVRARGSLAAQVGPLMELRVAGTVVARTEVRATEYQNYSFTVPAIAAGAKVDVVFNNDAVGNGEDRNLFVESVTINGVTVASTAAGVTFDRGAGAAAFDGLDVLAGLRTLLWNGALRLTAPGAAVASGLSPACASFYAANPGFVLNASRTVDPIAPLAKPVRGKVFAEPAYKTCEVRATDHTADGLPGYAKNDYSRRQAFNADNTLQLVVAQNGYFHLYDANTRAHLKTLPSFGENPEPQWHPTNPKLLYIAPHGGAEMSQKEIDVSTGAIRVVGDFKARLKTLFPGSTPGRAHTGGEGSPSKDGRYWCYMVRDAVAKNSFGSALGVGVFTWDRDTDTIVGSMRLNGEVPDHVSMSPSGDHCVVSSDGAIGTTAYSRDFSQSVRLLHNSQHSDLASDANGRDVYVAVDYSSNGGDVFFTDLKTGVRTLLFHSYIEGTATAFHFSGKAANKPGWVLVSAYADGCNSCGGPVRKWPHRKLMAVQLSANPTIYNLAFHRSEYAGYDTAPVASVNRDFTRVAFNSNFGIVGSQDVDAYVVEIPANALKPLVSPTPSPN